MKRESTLNLPGIQLLNVSQLLTLRGGTDNDPPGSGGQNPSDEDPGVEPPPSVVSSNEATT